MGSAYIPCILFVCLVSRGYVSATNLALCFKSDDASDDLNSCNAEIGDDLCLICPVNISNTSAIMWSRNHDLIYAGVNKLHKDTTIFQNICHPVLSSIQLKNISFAKFNDVYECLRRNQDLALITYKVSVIANAFLSIVNNGKNALSEETTSLECKAEGVLPPMTLTWLVNENIQRKELFNETVNHRVTSTYSFNQDGNSKTVECRVNGSHIKTASVTYNYQKATSGKEIFPSTRKSFFETKGTLNIFVQQMGNPLPQIIIGVFVLISGMLVACFFIYKHYFNNITRRERRFEGEIRLNYPVATHGVAELDVQTEVVQVPKDGNKRGSTIALQTCLKVGKKFEYWTCTFEDDESEIFVKTLSKESTLADANEFRKLALSLKKLRRHHLLVDRLLVLVENVPSVYYEYITNGTLRDMLMSQYQEARKSHLLTNNKKQLPDDMKSQVEVLLYLSCEVASAMVFLSSQKFCHPILSTRKVLLTETGHCKLYDVCPENMAVSIVEEKLDKEYPPIMWMSPEAVFLKQYSVDSDIWNYGTFLWEIFSLGEVPYAGLSKLQLEEKIRQTIVLAQPICCPGALYSIMTLCWNTSIDHRPPFQTIFGKISTLLENVTQEEQVLRCKASDYYSTLEMS